MQTLVEVKCDECGRKVKKIPAELRRQNHKFCNLSCAARFGHRSRPKKKLVTVKCDWCGENVEKEPNQARKYKTHFCGASCLGKYNRANGYGGREKIQRKCIYCDKTIEGSGKKFCSILCSSQFIFYKNIEEVERTGFCRPSPNFARKYFRLRFGNTCAICGIEEWNGQPAPTIIDHINGDSTNWALSNLRQICPNCDAQTETYKGKNKGNGRYYRRKRYAEGKSY